MAKKTRVTGTGLWSFFFSHAILIAGGIAMPYIQPDTRVYILKGVPLDNTYEHTVYYANPTSQLNAFLAYKKYELEKLSYQRTGAGLMRVQLTYEQMYDCNYMIFQNTAYGNKWWYAFITGVAYVNNTTCEISYEIDVMQTWCYDYTFMPTFVDREHVDPDTESISEYYNYTQPEGLESGSSGIIIGSKAIDTPAKYICYFATETNSGVHQAPQLISNYFTSLVFKSYEAVDNGSIYYALSQDAQADFNGYVNNGKGESLVSVFQSPTGSNPGTTLGTSEIYKMTSYYDGKLSDGYIPKNPKLMCYPFHYITISNREGSVITLRPELFNHQYESQDANKSTVECRLNVASYPSPLAMLSVINYGRDYNNLLKPGGSDQLLTNEDYYDYCLTITDFPNCAIANDSYKAWWAQNQNSYLATQGNIGRTYNTEMANIGNSYAQQMVSLKNSYGNNILSANTAYGNSLRSNQTALTNAGYSAAATMLGGAIKGGAEIAGGFLSLDGGAVASGAGTIAQSAIQAATIDEIAKNTANSNNAIATANLHAAASIGSNNFNSGRQIAELAKQASTLSALTNNQNATATLVAKKQDMMNVPDSSVGAIGGNSIHCIRRDYGFDIREMSAKKEYLIMADNYFEKYGYKIATMKTPSKMNNRPYWHYLQTAGCNIKGNFNVTDISAIKTIYNNGITTWNALENVGNYSLNNHTTVSTLSEENENE